MLETTGFAAFLTNIWTIRLVGCLQEFSGLFLIVWLIGKLIKKEYWCRVSEQPFIYFPGLVSAAIAVAYHLSAVILFGELHSWITASVMVLLTAEWCYIIYVARMSAAMEMVGKALMS